MPRPNWRYPTRYYSSRGVWNTPWCDHCPQLLTQFTMPINAPKLIDSSIRSLAKKIGDLRQTLSALYKNLGLENRSDVVAAQTSLDELRKILLQKTAFDRDVGGAVASGSKNQIQTLAVRWWKGAENILELRDAILLLAIAPRVQPFSNNQENQR